MEKSNRIDETFDHVRANQVRAAEQWERAAEFWDARGKVTRADWYRARALRARKRSLSADGPHLGR